MSERESAPQARRSRYTRRIPYAVTIVYNPIKFISASELYDKLAELKTKLVKYGTEWSDNVGIELKKNNVLHLHTYCVCDRSAWVRPERLWNIQLKKIKPGTDQIWLHYIKKLGNHPCAIEQREVESQIYLTPFTALFVE